MPRLHQDTCRHETCIPDEQLVSGHICRRTHVAGYEVLVRDTCGLYLGDVITIHLCHGRLVSLCIQQHTGDKLATILSSIQDTCRRRQVYTTCIRQHVSWCKRGLTDCCILIWNNPHRHIGFVQFMQPWRRLPLQSLSKLMLFEWSKVQIDNNNILVQSTLVYIISGANETVIETEEICWGLSE